MVNKRHKLRIVLFIVKVVILIVSVIMTPFFETSFSFVFIEEYSRTAEIIFDFVNIGIAVLSVIIAGVNLSKKHFVYINVKYDLFFASNVLMGLSLIIHICLVAPLLVMLGVFYAFS